nr:transposase [Aeromonas caviae]
MHREDRLSHPGRTDAVNPVLVNRYDQNALAQLHSISPVAWQHINMYGNFEFSPSTSKIDIDALVARYAEPEYWKQALIENENSSE